MVEKALLILIVLLSGCAGLQTGETSIEDMKKANDVSECVKVPQGPCGCANGGSSIAINQKYEEEYMQTLEEQQDEPVACPTVYQCYETEMKLENGSCSLEVNSSNLRR